MTFALLSTIVWVIDQVISLYIYVIIAAVIVSWLVVFNVVNIRNQFVRMMVTALNALTEPVFRLVRRVIPPIGGLDLSPLVVILLLGAIQYFLAQILISAYPGPSI